MHRTVNLFLLLFALVSAFVLYALKYDARRLELQVQEHERKMEELEGDMRVLKAEYAHLARPERIEPLARRLGLAPVSSRQYLRLDAGRSGPEESPTPAGRLR